MKARKTITLEFHCLENFYCVHIRSIYSDGADRLSTTRQKEICVSKALFVHYQIYAYTFLHGHSKSLC